MKRPLICLALMLSFVGVANAQTKSMTGTVIDYSVGNRGTWAGITIKVGDKKYFVYTESTESPTPTIVGKVDEVGRTVQVFYARIVNSPDYDGELSATKIVEIKGSKSLSDQSSDWVTFWNAFRAAVQKRDRPALQKMMSQEFQFYADSARPDQAIKFFDTWDNGRDWIKLNKIVSQGTEPYRSPNPSDKGASRIGPAGRSRNNTGPLIIFNFGNEKRWRWTFYGPLSD